MEVRLSTYRQNQPVVRGNYLFIGAVRSALDYLGIKDIHVADPEQVFAALASRKLEGIAGTSSEFCIFIDDTLVTSDNRKDITNLMQQAGIKKNMLPVIISGLRCYSDDPSKHYLGVRLGYTDESQWMYAPTLKGETFRTKRNQTLAEILTEGRNHHGNLEIATPYNKDGKLIDSKILANYHGLNPLSYDTGKLVLHVLAFHDRQNGRVILTRR